MRARGQQFEQYDEWRENDRYPADVEGSEYREYDSYPQYDAEHAYGAYDDDAEHGGWGDGRALMEVEQSEGLLLQQEQSLVNVSSTVTHHGTPLLSYTRTMNRFYTNRKQRLSLGRYTCEVCNERIRLWAWETPSGNRTHDGCYERLAWTWTNLYAQQQRLASEGSFE